MLQIRTGDPDHEFLRENRRPLAGLKAKCVTSRQIRGTAASELRQRRAAVKDTDEDGIFRVSAEASCTTILLENMRREGYEPVSNRAWCGDIDGEKLRSRSSW